MKRRSAPSGSVMMEGLGKIKRENTGSLTFEPIPELLNPGGVFALPKIEIPVTEKREITRTVTEHKKSLPHPEVRRRRNWWIPAIAVIVLAMISFSKLLYRADHPYSRHYTQKRNCCCKKQGSKQDCFWKQGQMHKGYHKRYHQGGYQPAAGSACRAGKCAPV